MTVMVANLFHKIFYIIKFGSRLEGNKFSVGKTTNIKISKTGKIKIGKVILNENSFICASGFGRIIINDNVTINRNTIIVSKSEITIGEGTSIGPNVCIYDHDHTITTHGFVKDQFVSEKIVIGNNVWIASNVTILKGTKIGDNSIIGAGTVLKGIIPDNSIVYTMRKLVIKENSNIGSAR